MPQIRTPSTLEKEQYLELPPHERGKYLRNVIKKTLEQNEQGVSVSQLEEALPFDKRAIQKHLEVLVHTNVAYTSQVGPTKLYHPNDRAMHTGLEKEFSINGKEYGFYTADNRLGEFVLIQERKEDSDDVEGGIIVPLSGFSQFVKEIEEFDNEVNNG